ncbi:MAG: MFS transporter, partial [Bacteroidota bacterium]
MTKNIPAVKETPSDLTAKGDARSGSYRWAICAMLFFATTINYVDRSVLGLLAPVLQKEIGWDEIDYGNIVAAFMAAYAIGIFFAGRFVDKVGTKIGFSVSIVVWSIAAMGHALARSVFGFGAARAALGLGESGNFPSSNKAIAEWFPKKERALAVSLFNSGANVGALVVPLVVPWIALTWSW